MIRGRKQGLEHFNENAKTLFRPGNQEVKGQTEKNVNKSEKVGVGGWALP